MIEIIKSDNKNFPIYMCINGVNHHLSIEASLEIEQKLSAINKQFKKKEGITFELEHNQLVNIKRNGEKIGHIFSPGGSGHRHINVVQVCGFNEAFDLWGCAVFANKKDIQLLFDDQTLKGKSMFSDGCVMNEGCDRCFMIKCECENNNESMPFNLKREHDLKDRIEYKKFGDK